MTTKFTIRPQALQEAADGLNYLKGVARVGGTVTYKQFAEGIEYTLPLYGNELGDVLGLINRVHGGPELTALVVRADTGKPGAGRPEYEASA